MKLLLLFGLLLPLATSAGQPSEFYLTNIATLIAPTKLAAVSKHKASEQVQKVMALLEDARMDGFGVPVIVENAVIVARYTNAWLAAATYKQLCANYQTADFLGVFNGAGLKEMRRGKSPIVTRGPLKGDELLVDPILPNALAPELGKVIANLQLMPSRSNKKKGDSVSPKQLLLARQFREAGVLSDASCKKMLKHQQLPPGQALPQQLPQHAK